MGLDADQVGKNLWVGSAPDPKDVDPEKFPFVVLAAEEVQPDEGDFPDGVNVLRVPMGDHADQRVTTQDAVRYHKAAQAVNKARKQGPVLVTCNKGLDRSATLASAALMLGPERLDAKGAVAQVRKYRDGAMRNPQLIAMLGHFAQG